MFQGGHRVFVEFDKNVFQDTRGSTGGRGPVQVWGYVSGGQPRVQQRAAHYS